MTSPDHIRIARDPISNRAAKTAAFMYFRHSRVSLLKQPGCLNYLRCPYGNLQIRSIRNSIAAAYPFQKRVEPKTFGKPNTIRALSVAGLRSQISRVYPCNFAQTSGSSASSGSAALSLPLLFNVVSHKQFHNIVGRSDNSHPTIYFCDKFFLRNFV
jgi:hypothetical protein